MDTIILWIHSEQLKLPSPRWAGIIDTTYVQVYIRQLYNYGNGCVPFGVIILKCHQSESISTTIVYKTIHVCSFSFVK